MVDLWARQAATIMPEALEEGFHNFTWHMAMSIAKKLDPIARTRAYALPFGGQTKIMLIDFPGAVEYDLFSHYRKPIAVYPTWSPEEDDWIQLVYLVKNPVGDMKRYYGDESVIPEQRPVKGQKHRVVLHRIPTYPREQFDFLSRVQDLQDDHPDVEIFLSGFRTHVFMDYRIKAADYIPVCMESGKIFNKILLPTGKELRGEKLFDLRYKDWFELLGVTQQEIFESVAGDRRLLPRYCYRSLQWAKRNWHSVEPFAMGVGTRKRQGRSRMESVSAEQIILPGMRRRVMRNLGALGYNVGELDRFACDTCILHNACKLYREGSVCTVKGAETVSLAESFGTRSAAEIIRGLSALLERQTERLEDALAAEDPGEPSAEVTRQINSVFANGVKLAKLYDPTLSGSKVQVNVGVSGNAQVAIAATDPRQLTASIVAELEAAGIARDDITSDMIAGYLKSLGVATSDDPAVKAIAAASAIAVKPNNKGTGVGRKKKEPKVIDVQPIVTPLPVDLDEVLQPAKPGDTPGELAPGDDDFADDPDA